MSSKTLFVALALAAAFAADVSDTCTPCTSAATIKATATSTITRAGGASTYTCTAAATGLDLVAAAGALKCENKYFYTAPVAAAQAKCDICVDAGAAAGANAASWTCKTSAATGVLKVNACSSAFYLVAGASDAAADSCVACTSVGTTAATGNTIAGAATGATFTCTAAHTGIDFATGSCDNGYYYTAKPSGTIGTGAKCDACTVAAALAGLNAASWTCKADKNGVLKVKTCNSAFYLSAGASDTAADSCVACTSVTGTAATTITNFGTGATFTCASGTNTGIDFAGAVKCAPGYFYTAATGAIGATCSQCMDGATPAVALVAPDGIKAGVVWTCDKKTGGRVVIPSTGCNIGYKSGIVTPPQSSAGVASASVAVLAFLAALTV